MKSEEVRLLWLFVLFDLPVGTKDERRAASRFRNFLKDDGYMMLQFSVYARVCRGEDAVDSYRCESTGGFFRRVTYCQPAR
jgi:CRISPR-associated protein Cas2